MLTQGKNTAEFLLSEGNGSISREEVVISSTAGALVPGTVLGKVTVGGEYVAYASGAADGSENAAGILYAKVADSAADQSAVAIVRHAEVIAAELTGLDAAARVELLALGIVCR